MMWWLAEPEKWQWERTPIQEGFKQWVSCVTTAGCIVTSAVILNHFSVYNTPEGYVKKIC